MSRGKGDRPEQQARDPKFASERFATVVRCHGTNGIDQRRCKVPALQGSLYCSAHSE